MKKSIENQSYKFLLLREEALTTQTEIGKRFLELTTELQNRGFNFILSTSYYDSENVVTVEKDIDVLLIDWSPSSNEETAKNLISLIKKLHKTQKNVPVFLFSEKLGIDSILSGETLENIDENVLILQEEIAFISERISRAVIKYRDNLLPPLAKAIFNYNKVAEYSWAAPGHQSGVGFSKNAIGRKFFDFYGENLFRTDTGIERTSLGSLLDHTGAFLESEKNIARIFGADRSYNVLVGTSASNRTIMQACLTDVDIALTDRNCHKSIEQGLILTGAKPVYMIPTRNRYGIIGPILPKEMTQEAVLQKILVSPLIEEQFKKNNPEYTVITNCTYDGIVYNAAKVEENFEPFINRIHFDEAWYGYARFSPLYENHFAMRGNPSDYRGSTVFATHSTHKLLNALSQASFIHMRYGKKPISEERFNQSYMIQATTSPLYAIAVSNDIGAAMMDGESGPLLMEEVIHESIAFRKKIAQLHREFKEKGEWFFKPWNPETVIDPVTKKEYSFEEAPMELLMKEQSCWKLNPGDIWHGFENIPEDWAILDPIKVSILAPGMGDDGKMIEKGVPADLISYYFSKYGIVPTRTTDFQVMFLFSMGINEGKWATLVDMLLSFKKHYDNNVLLKTVLPDLVAGREETYDGKGLKDLGEEMFEYLKENNPSESLNLAYSTLPTPVLTPREAFNKIVKNEVELIPADKLINRITANSVIPYPPGIPMLMSGENFGDINSPQINYLKSLSTWDKNFPGFEHETEGTVVKDGIYHVLCVKDNIDN